MHVWVIQTDRRLGLLVALLIAATFSAACRVKPPADPVQAPSRLHGGVFRYAESSDLPALDPVRCDDTASTHAATQLYEGLVALGDDLQPEPALAERWTVSADGLEWRFQLRTDAFYHDDPCFAGGRGRALTAADVKLNFERLCDPESGSTGYWIFAGKIAGADAFHQGRAPGVRGFSAPSPDVFVVRLTRPYAPLLRLMAMPYALVVAPEAIQRYGERLDRHPVGTGPFRLAAWAAGEGLEMVRHPRYWGRDADGRQLPYLDGVQVIFEPDAARQVALFERGALEQLYPIPSDYFAELVVPEGGVRTGVGNFVIQSAPELDVQYYGMRMDAPPFQGNRALRQALNYAVDRRALVDEVLRRGTPAHHGVLPPGLPGFNPALEGYRYDPELARSLLTAAGYPDGRGLSEMTLEVNAGGTATVEVAEAVAAQLGRLGLRVRVEARPWPEHLRRVEEGEAPLFRMAWLADYPDPENFLALFYSAHWAPRGPNTTHYANPAFDRLFEQALSTADTAARDALYHQAEALVVEDAPWIFLFHAESYRLIQPWVRGYPINPLDYRVLKRVRLAQP